MKSKLKHLLAGALLILPLALQGFMGLQPVQAAEKTVKADPHITSVVLTKLVFDTNDTSEHSFNNKGAEVTDLQGGKPVDGVTFSVYNVTDKINAGQTTTEIQEEAAKSGNAAEFGDPIATEKTANGGIINFDLPNVKDGEYQTYLILETGYAEPEAKGDHVIIERATPIVLTMPVATESTDGKVYLYPKNYDQDSVIKDLTDKTHPSHGLGETAEYKITVPIPYDIANRDYYTVSDRPDKGLDDLAKTLQVEVGGHIIYDANHTSGCTVTDIPANDKYGLGFLANLNLEELSKYAGQTMTLTYQAQVTIPMVGDLKNHATIDFNHHPHHTDGKTPVEVGGVKFIKKDANQKDALKDAVFILEDKDGKIVTMVKDTEGRDVYKTIDASKLDVQKLNAAIEDKTGADKLAAAKIELKNQLGDEGEHAVIAITGEDGTFEFKGLKYGDYKTVEIAAPKGYAVATKATPFPVNKGSYTNPITITNTKRGVLPSTGGLGIYLVIALGLVVMIGGVAVLKKGSRHTEV